jgi:hypothetical protein
MLVYQTFLPWHGKKHRNRGELFEISCYTLPQQNPLRNAKPPGHNATRIVRPGPQGPRARFDFIDHRWRWRASHGRRIESHVTMATRAETHNKSKKWTSTTWRFPEIGVPQLIQVSRPWLRLKHIVSQHFTTIVTEIPHHLTRLPSGCTPDVGTMSNGKAQGHFGWPLPQVTSTALGQGPGGMLDILVGWSASQGLQG